MQSVRLLIDKAAEKCGGYASLARIVGVTPQRVAAWRSGDRPITAEQTADLCLLLDLTCDECRAWACQALVEHPKNEERRDRLRRAFFLLRSEQRRRASDSPDRRALAARH